MNLPCSSEPIQRIVAENNILFQGHGQHDSLEFFNTFLAILSEELNTASKKKEKVDIDHGIEEDDVIYELTLYRDRLR